MRLSDHEQRLLDQRSGAQLDRAAEAKDENEFNRIRDMVLVKVRDRINCASIGRLSAGCERANCACAEIALDVAGAIVYGDN